MTDVKALYQVRGNIRTYFAAAGQDLQPMLSDGGAQIMVQGLPERAELVKLGASWGAAVATGSAFAPVAAWPTATANLTIYNGESAGGPCYVLDRAWMTSITGGMTGPLQLLGQVVPVGAAASGLAGATGGPFTDSANVNKWHLSGRSSAYAGNAKFLTGNGNVGVTNRWFAIGPSTSLTASNAGAVSVGLGVEANLYGRIILPPGAYFNLMNVGGQAIGTAICGLDWHEVLMNLG